MNRADLFRAIKLRTTVHPGSKIAMAILIVVGVAHLLSHYGVDNAVYLLMCPLTVLLCPEAFLSSGITNPVGGAWYITGVILNAYLLGYLMWWVVMTPSLRIWSWYRKPSS